MEVAEHIATLRREGELLAAAASHGSLDVPIATCPGWTMRDLVRHIGGVHRWATGYVAERRTKPWRVDLDDVVGAWPRDADLVDWFRNGHQRLIDVLLAAPPDLECFTFLAAPSPLAMWARRQAHETAIHRVDAELPSGCATGFEPAFAADGVDELLSCFVTRRNRGPEVDHGITMQVKASDTGDAWHLQIEPESVTTSRTDRPADCTLTATAGDLYRLLWNRRDAVGVGIQGDRSVLDLWSETVRVRWN